MEKEEANVEENTEPSTIKYFVMSYYDSQAFRIQIANRITHSKNDKFKSVGQEMIERYKDVEETMEKAIKAEVDTYHISNWLLAQKGIGGILAGGLIAYIHPISRFSGVQKLWAYAGMGVMQMCQKCGKRYIIDSKKGQWILHTADRLGQQNAKLKDDAKKQDKEALVKKAESMLCHCTEPELKSQSQRRIAGQLIDYNPQFKKHCYLVGKSFIYQKNSPYRKLYDEFKTGYMNRPDLMEEMDSRKKGISTGRGHIDDMARRKVIKIFLAHLWEVWRQQEGLPTPDAYAFSVLGHTNRIPPFPIEIKEKKVSKRGRKKKDASPIPEIKEKKKGKKKKSE